jgi:hypothetical protein
MSTFERRILRKLYGSVPEERRVENKVHSGKLYQVNRFPSIRTTEAASFAGHQERIGNGEISSRIVDSKLGSRGVGRPKLRWMDGAMEDLRKVGIQIPN